jgi:hypothetical protein
VPTKVLVEHVTSTFRVEEEAKHETCMKAGGKQKKAGVLWLVSCLAYFSTLKIEVSCSSKIMVASQQTIWHYIKKTELSITNAVRTPNPKTINLFKTNTLPR